MKTWVFQSATHRKRHGDAAPWSVGYYDPSGRRKAEVCGSKSMADKKAARIAAKLIEGTYDDVSKKTWEEFRADYEANTLRTMNPKTRKLTEIALKHFERIIKPVKMVGVDARAIDKYIATRRVERTQAGNGKTAKSKKPLSAATVNRELRHLRAAFRKAVRRKFLNEAPAIVFVREEGKVTTYITPEDFAAIYKAAGEATSPAGYSFAAGDWWRALLVTAYMTGWRVGSLLALRWADVDLDAGTAFSRAADNKGKRDQLVPLHPLVVEHLRRLLRFGENVFPWPHVPRKLWDDFEAIQKAAGVKPPHGKARYGFHDLRRAFATMNADRLSADALQALMQHKSYTTTQRYINMARQLNQAVDGLFVPNVTAATAIG